MKRLDFYLAVLILAAAILVAGVLASPTIKVGGPAGVSTMQAGAGEIVPVQLVGIALSHYSPAVPVRIVGGLE